MTYHQLDVFLFCNLSSHMDEQSDEVPEISLEEHEENSDFLKIDEIGKFMVALANYRSTYDKFKEFF